MSAQPPENSVHPESRRAWRAWLRRNHERAEGVWLVRYKKASGRSRMEDGEAIEEALCFGWIDSKPRKLDDERSMLWFAPRKPKSGWSRINKERVRRLLGEGLMEAAGRAKVEAAKRDGSWNALDAVEALEVPDDLSRELRRYPRARRHFDAFPLSVKKGILGWIASARRGDTRTRRIEETARLAEDDVRANQWRSKEKGR